MNSLEGKDSAPKITETEEATTSKTTSAGAAAVTKILPPKKGDSNDAEVVLNKLTLTDQNHNNIPNAGGTNVNRNGTEIEKPSATATATANNEAARYGIVREPRKVLNSVMGTQQQIQKPFRADVDGTKEYQQQCQRQIMTRMLQSGYSSAYAQMMAASTVQPQVASRNAGSELRSLSRGKPCFWKGELPPRNYCNPVFSSKVFVGGVPWDITETALLEAFSKYGTCRVEWPNKESRHARANTRRAKVTGYVYMIFDNDWAVKKLLQDCSQEFGTAGEWYFRLTTRRSSGLEIRQVQVIPWVISDASYVLYPNMPLDMKKTVFVGALHGMITAQVLFSIMRDVYGDVLFVGLDTDRQKYPIGSARVTFATQAAYFRAIESGYLEIRTSKFTKKVQIDPFLEDAKCSQCECVPGPYFCRERSCFKYFCLQCWEVRHALTGPYGNHKPMIRTPRRPLQSGTYVTYGTASCPVSYDARTVTQQYFRGVAPELGIQMNMRPVGSDQVTEMNKPPGLKLALGQPTYLWPGYPKQPLNQVQVWVPSANQIGIIKQDSAMKQRLVNSFRRIPYTTSSSFAASRNGQNHNESSLRMENVDGTLSASGAASTSSSVPSSETISSNPSP